MASQPIFKRAYVRTKPYPEKKVRIVNELKELFSKYSTVFVIDIHGTPNRVIQEYRFWLRRRGSRIIKAKNTLVLIALRQLMGGVDEKLRNLFTGENLLIFTNENPYELAKWIWENGVRREAMPGDIAPFDLVAPAGNTNMGPGPIMSKFGKLKIPIRVQDGKIWIVLGLPYFISLIPALEAGIVNNFTLNKVWTFRDRSVGYLVGLGKYHVASFIGMAVNYAVTNLLYYVLGVNGYAAYVIGVIFGFLANYIMAEVYVFKYRGVVVNNTASTPRS